MNPESQDFTQLRRLLALKRHEQPPPAYFHDFSRQVIVRIRAGATGDPESAMVWEVPWLRRLWAAFETKPILAGAFGVLVCGLLLGGVIYTDQVDRSPVNLANQAVAPGSLPTGLTATVPLGGMAASDFPSTAGLPTAPAYNAVFDGIKLPQATFTGFSLDR